VPTTATDWQSSYTWTGTDEYGNAEETPARYDYVGSNQRQRDTNSDLQLMGERVYDSATGRFLQTDPVLGGSSDSYDYVSGDPVNRVDLSGAGFCYIAGEILGLLSDLFAFDLYRYCDPNTTGVEYMSVRLYTALFAQGVGTFPLRSIWTFETWTGYLTPPGQERRTQVHEVRFPNVGVYIIRFAGELSASSPGGVPAIDQFWYDVDFVCFPGLFAPKCNYYDTAWDIWPI
jgi:RHS repeat-associated protein